MLTLRKEESLIRKLKSLSEIELTGLLEELNEHLLKEKMYDLRQNAFGKDRIDDLEHELSESEDRVTELESERDDLERWSKDAVKTLEAIDCDDAPEEIEKQIKRAIEILE